MVIKKVYNFLKKTGSIEFMIYESTVLLIEINSSISFNNL